MIASADDLMRELHARGVPTGDPVRDPPAHPDADRPWYIGFLLGVSGWVAGIFVLVFIFMLFQLRSPASALIIGVVLLVAAWGLYRVDRDGAFVSQLALALSVAGQLTLLFGLQGVLFKESRTIAGLAFVAVVLELTLIAAIPNGLHRTMSTLYACSAWALFVRYAIWDEPRFDLFGGGTRPGPPIGLALLGWAIAWLPVAWALHQAIRREPSWMATGHRAIMRPVCTGLIVGLAIATLVSYPLDTFSWGGPAQHSRNWLALWPLLSVFAALGAMAAAVGLGSRALLAVSIVAALLHVSHFYYTMGISLLAKSVTMLLLGVVLLGAAHYVKRRSLA
jgi:hypothetical protein